MGSSRREGPSLDPLYKVPYDLGDLKTDPNFREQLILLAHLGGGRGTGALYSLLG